MNKGKGELFWRYEPKTMKITKRFIELDIDVFENWREQQRSGVEGVPNIVDEFPYLSLGELEYLYCWYDA